MQTADDRRGNNSIDKLFVIILMYIFSIVSIFVLSKVSKIMVAKIFNIEILSYSFADIKINNGNLSIVMKIIFHFAHFLISCVMSFLIFTASKSIYYKNHNEKLILKKLIKDYLKSLFNINNSEDTDGEVIVNVIYNRDIKTLDVAIVFLVSATLINVILGFFTGLSELLNDVFKTQKFDLIYITIFMVITSFYTVRLITKKKKSH